MLPITLLLLLGAETPAARPEPWASFSRSGALSHVRETVEIATGKRRSKTEFPYMLRYTRTVLQGAPTIIDADIASCPAIGAVVASMQTLKMPTPAPYGLPTDSLSITADGALYTLSAPSSDTMGRFTISSNVGSPLAAWVDAALRQLSPCWSAPAP